jgi:glycosyltransferase involved in cell wall biosynthesis
LIPVPRLCLLGAHRLKLVIFHFHLRPGGVRRVIEVATPFLLREMPWIEGVILATGEARDTTWNKAFQRALSPISLEICIEPTFGYVSEQASTVRSAARIRLALARLLSNGTPALVWAHNFSVGRNLALARELVRACEAHGHTVVMHHHDWWFDNRWKRWPEMQRSAVRSLHEAARILFSTGRVVRVAAINSNDANLLRRHFGKRVMWLPNPAERTRPPTSPRVHAAVGWLRRVVDDDAPIWLLPSRQLRRKNIVEALLLTRWLRPEATLVVTGGVSSDDERDYAQRLSAAARGHGWRLELGVLAQEHSRQPALRELFAASECVLLTSLKEGFGYAFLEAAEAARPLIARRLRNIGPDLAKFGFRFPQTYDELLIAPGLFSWAEEQARQRRLFREWKAKLPRGCRNCAEQPALLALETPRPVPFSRLTLTAQLEMLARPVAESWALCAPLNPFLRAWKRRASTGRLGVSSWPSSADHWLSGPAYAHRFGALVRREMRDDPGGADGLAAQTEFVRSKLRTAQLFPLLLSPNT